MHSLALEETRENTRSQSARKPFTSCLRHERGGGGVHESTTKPTLQKMARNTSGVPGHVRGRRVADLREKQTLRILVAGHRRWRLSVASSLTAQKQHVPVPSSRCRSYPAESDAAAAVTQIPGAETRHRLEKTRPEAAAAAIPRLAVDPQVSRRHRSVHYGRGLFDDAHDLGRRDDAAVRVQRYRLVSSANVPSSSHSSGISFRLSKRISPLFFFLNSSLEASRTLGSTTFLFQFSCHLSTFAMSDYQRSRIDIERFVMYTTRYFQ